MSDFWWTKGCWGRLSHSTSVSLVNLHYTNFSTITIAYHLGLEYEEIQSHPTNKKNKKALKT
jgi:hypothetical protein